MVANTYTEIPLNLQGRRWSEELGLFLGIDQEKLRYFTSEGQIIPTPGEFSKIETQRAEAEAQRANSEAERANSEARRAEAEAIKSAKFSAKLLELGINPDSL